MPPLNFFNTRVKKFTVIICSFFILVAFTFVADFNFKVLAAAENKWEKIETVYPGHRVPNDQQVDNIDLNTLIANFNVGNTVWSQGDFDSSGVVNILDLSILLSNFGN